MELRAGDGAAAWFPVIDRDACTGCGQCHDFCLFGVYRKEPGVGMLVADPGHCKDGCPACARVCPAGAIIFPKHAEAAIHGGPRTAADHSSEAADLMAALRARRARQRLVRPDVAQALADRDACLTAAKPAPEQAACGCAGGEAECDCDACVEAGACTCPEEGDAKRGACGPDCACHREPR